MLLDHIVLQEQHRLSPVQAEHMVSLHLQQVTPMHLNVLYVQVDITVLEDIFRVAVHQDGLVQLVQAPIMDVDGVLVQELSLPQFHVQVVSFVTMVLKFFVQLDLGVHQVLLFHLIAQKAIIVQVESVVLLLVQLQLIHPH